MRIFLTQTLSIGKYFLYKLLSGLELHVDKLISIGKYLASEQYVRFVHLQPILYVFFLHADYCITLFAFVESNTKE